MIKVAVTVFCRDVVFHMFAMGFSRQLCDRATFPTDQEMIVFNRYIKDKETDFARYADLS